MPGYETKKQDIGKRLRRIEGQVCGVQRMGKSSPSKGLLPDARVYPRAGRTADAKVAEASAAIGRLVRS